MQRPSPAGRPDIVETEAKEKGGEKEKSIMLLSGECGLRWRSRGQPGPGGRAAQSSGKGRDREREREVGKGAEAGKKEGTGWKEEMIPKRGGGGGKGRKFSSPSFPPFLSLSLSFLYFFFAAPPPPDIHLSLLLWVE